MKYLIQVDLIFLLSLLFVFSVFADDNTTTTGALEIRPFKAQHTLSFTSDGQIEINGKPVEKMSDPEIKAAIREFVDAYKKQVENDEMVKYYDRQTGYLLQELEKCQKRCGR